MKILLTGAAGFIGHHVAEILLKDGHQVFGVDSINAYYDPSLKKYRLALLETNKNFSNTQINLAHKEATEKVFAQIAPDAVIHLAAQAGVRYSLTHPHAYTESNVEAFLNVLEGCRQHKVKKLLYASSSSVYGGLTELPFHEDMKVDCPVSLYAATKRANEMMAHSYSHLYGFPSTGLRFFTVYGPKGRPDMALWLFSEAILKGEAIKVFNHGHMRRDFTYIDDIARGVVGALHYEQKLSHEVFNLGNHRSEELGDMISILEKALGREAKKEFLPLQAGDVPDTYAAIEKAQKAFGYKPETKLEDGIPRFVNWFLNDWKKRTF